VCLFRVYAQPGSRCLSRPACSEIPRIEVKVDRNENVAGYGTDLRDRYRGE
jgi:hypothetical protein